MKDKYLPQLATEKLGSFCLSEPASGSDAFALKTKAEKTADGYKLNGSKMWVTNAADAGIFLIFANLDPSKGYKGITCFVAEKEWGVQIAKKEKKVQSHFLVFHILFPPAFRVPGSPFPRYALFVPSNTVAWYPRLVNLSPPPRRPPHPERKPPWRRRRRLQNCHPNPQRRPHRHRRTNDRPSNGLVRKSHLLLS